VPRHVARLVSRIIAWLVVDYFAYAARLGASARRAAHHLSSTISPTPRDRVPWHVAWLVVWLVASLVVDYSASRRLVVDYFASAARLGALVRRAACLADRRVARRRLLRLRRSSGCLDTSPDSSPVIDYFTYAVAGCLGTLHGSSRGSLRRSSPTTSHTPRVRVPRHVARPVTRLIVDYSVRRDFVLRPRWLYFSHAMRRDYLSRGNTGSTSSLSRATMTSSSGHIVSTIHLDKFSKLV
jgi:hypothetical protein